MNRRAIPNVTEIPIQRLILSVYRFRAGRRGQIGMASVERGYAAASRLKRQTERLGTNGSATPPLADLTGGKFVRDLEPVDQGGRKRMTYENPHPEPKRFSHG